MKKKVLWVKNLEDIYKFGSSIGTGSYGKVLKAFNVETKQNVVCKIVSRKGDYVRELDHLISLRKCYGVLPIRQAIFTTSQLCLEFQEGESSLQKYIKDRKISSKKPEEDLRSLLYEALSITNQLLITMSHIHTNNIVHRDLKSGNIVITRDEKGVRAWTIDFGMSKRIIGTDDNQDVSNYEIVTATYRAPELWRPARNINDNDDSEEEEDDSVEFIPIEEEKNEPTTAKVSKERKYNQRVDIWSVGCILFEIIAGYCPFTGKDEKEIREKISGHMIHILGSHDTTICLEKPKSINIEKELDNIVKKIITKGTREGKSMDYMDLCSSMEDMTVTPQGTRKFTKRCSSSGTNFLPKDCEAIMFVIRKLLRGLLHPNPEKRLTAEIALKEFGKYSRRDDSIIGTPVDVSQPRILNNMSKKSFMNVMQSCWVALDHLKYNTNVVYLGIYLWIRCVTVSPELCKEFSLSTIMMASFRMAISYMSEDIRDLRTLRRHISKKHEEKSPRREVNCTSSILTIFEGRIWIKNPGDIRHLIIPGCKKGKWDTNVEKTIFCVIMSKLSKKFVVPNPDSVVSRSLELLKIQYQKIQEQLSDVNNNNDMMNSQTTGEYSIDTEMTDV
jgi:serine/threonine protein kinase